MKSILSKVMVVILFIMTLYSSCFFSSADYQFNPNAYGTITKAQIEDGEFNAEKIDRIYTLANKGEELFYNFDATKLLRQANNGGTFYYFGAPNFTMYNRNAACVEPDDEKTGTTYSVPLIIDIDGKGGVTVSIIENRRVSRGSVREWNSYAAYI